jgi:hypothetical protein
MAMQKAALKTLLVWPLALGLCQCSTTTEPDALPGLSSSWQNWESAYIFDSGQTFYLDPVAGNVANPGTPEAPLGSLAEVLANDLIQRRVAVTHPYQEGGALELANPDAPIGPGDTLILLSGDHGWCRIVESHHSEFISIVAGAGEVPVLSGIELVGVEHYRIVGVVVQSPSQGEGGGTLVDLESHDWRGPCRYIIVEDCLISSGGEATNWSAEEWDSRAATGISAAGAYLSLRGNHLLNVNHGLMVGGQYALVEHNIVENFCGDGMRGIGNDMIFQYNTVKNCYDVNENHDDGFQSFSVNGQPPRERVVLRGNIIIGYTDPAQPHRGTLQGIGCFDGMYIDWVIENNVVATDHWHGITLLGAQNCRIVNNTVVDLNDQDPGPPWVRIGPHKDGRSSHACLIRNNIAASILPSDGVTADHNLETTDYEAMFVDYAELDLRLREDCPAVDAGSGDQAPPTDIAGIVRPQGAGVDLGAYER